MHNSKPFRFNAVVESMSGSNHSRAEIKPGWALVRLHRRRLARRGQVEVVSWSSLLVNRRRGRVFVVLVVAGTWSSSELVARRNWSPI